MGEESYGVLAMKGARSGLEVSFTPLLLERPLLNERPGYTVRTSSGLVLRVFYKLEGFRETWKFLTVNAASLCCGTGHFRLAARYFCERCGMPSSLETPRWDEENATQTLEAHLQALLLASGEPPLSAQLEGALLEEAIQEVMAEVRARKVKPIEAFEVAL